MQWWGHLQTRQALPPWDDDIAIREEAFGRERLESHGESLARAQRISSTAVPAINLHDRLAENEQQLLQAHRVIARAVAEGRSVSPGAEWLVNNSHVVEEQIRDVRKNLPRAYYEQLPKLADGPLAGHPRILGVAWAFVAHTDSRFDYELLHAFVAAYQRIDPLQIGELWALPLTLRLVLVENLRRAARRIVRSRDERKEADALIDAYAARADGTTGPFSEASLTGADGQLRTAFIVQLVHRMGDGHGDTAPAREWLRDELSRLGTSPDDVVQREHQTIGATNNTVRHIIRSMRVMPDVDWAVFFERASLVDAALGLSPAFSGMDFATRNAYRDVIERLGRRSPLSEIEIAQQAVKMAQAQPSGSKKSEPGYYLLGKGCRKLEVKIGFKRQARDVLVAVTQKGGLPGYIASISLLTSAILSLPVLALAGQSVATGTLIALLLAGLFPAMELAIAIVNQAIAHEITPRVVASLELRQGVPDEARTLVVVPTLLTDLQSIEELIDRLEVHHLATQQRNVFYALLTDWTDSETRTTGTDEALLEQARQGIARLNRQHATGIEGEARFYLFHRRRQWNAQQGCWMGWERKRGKLHELNRVLRGADDTSFLPLEQDATLYPQRVVYVVTLDSDTRLPRDAVRRLVGKMLHPLNRPVFSKDLQRVIDGYALLQPRVTPSLPAGSDASVFQKIFTSSAGIDPYAGAVSDVYQDLFGEGSFAGKGIYDIDAFESAIKDRFSENTVLSHDLLEGLYARAGLATDVEVIEEFPSRYDVARARDHRWARGDWQLLSWIVSGRDSFYWSRERTARDQLPALGRWKLTDNLRRTVTPIALVVSLILAWQLPLAPAAIWTAFAAAAIAVPTVLGIAAGLSKVASTATLKSHFLALAADARMAAIQSALHLTLIADRAFLMFDAIVRTLYRLLVSRKNLLEWTTAAQSKSLAVATVAGYYQRMFGGVLVGFIALILVWNSGADGVYFALPVTALWMMAPLIARWVSFKPAAQKSEPLTFQSRVSLRLVARRTWFYFEDFVNEESHFLPPDNFQEVPRPVVAQRTSPTNIGLYLLSTLSAHSFGWISVLDATERLEKTLRTLSGMPRHRGHFFNWYDTRSLSVLEPSYVSTVDSGNLAGHLLVVASACRNWSQQLEANSAAHDGLSDCITLLNNSLPATGQETSLASALAALCEAASKNPVATTGTADGELNWDIVAAKASLLSELLEHGVAAPVAYKAAGAVKRLAESHQRHAALDAGEKKRLLRRLVAIAETAEYMALSMDFSFLINPERELLSIGYSVDAARLDESCYDLLASEARLASFIAIAKGDLESRHWFKLGRTLLPVNGRSVLISWSGSMFEYLMPDLVTMTPAESLLGSSIRVAVAEHIRFGAKNNAPWGVSESAYNARDLEFTYQYLSFGVPELGLKRGLGENYVVAPYATALASGVVPNAAAQNYQRLAGIGGCGAYGFYEAIDFTPTRVAPAETFEVVKAYMAHHQGMTIVALANTVLDSVIARLFHDAPIVKAAELLLQERAPRLLPKPTQRATLMRARPDDDELSLAAVRFVNERSGPTPDCHFLGQGHLNVLMTASGAGYTRWKGLAITRWHGDPTLDNLGSFVYLRDPTTGVLWSAGSQPAGVSAKGYEAAFTEDRVQLSRTDGTLKTILDVIVSPEDPATCRRVSISNFGKKHRTIDVTSYEELALSALDADSAHPAFSKLFIETSVDEASGALIATRRRRTASEPEVFAASFVVSGPAALGAPDYETDRSKFIGRGRSLAVPLAIINGRPLEGTTGAVIDPVFAIRQRVSIPPGATVRIAFWMVVAPSREALQPLIEKYKDASAFSRSATLAWTHGLVELRHLGIEADDAMLFQQVAGALVYASPALRAADHVLRHGALGFGALWPAGISGDLPIVLARISEIEDIGLVRQLLHAFEYWRSKGIEADLVILNDHTASYQQELQSALETMCQSVPGRHRLGRDSSKGSVYILRADLIEPRTLAALPAAARAVFHARRGALAEQVARLTERVVDGSKPPSRPAPAEVSSDRLTTADLDFFNGYGGFRDGGREYVIVLDAGQSTPAPWINVIANPAFGFQVSAEGGGYTWGMNCRERQITPWANDPVMNRSGEVFYILDQESGELWSPTASPIRDHTAPYIVSHGQGYTRFEHTSRGIELVLEQFIAGDDPVKISRLTLRNKSGKPRRLLVTSYAEWVLGTSRRTAGAQITTEYDSAHAAIFARNPWHHFFPDRVAFSRLSGTISGWTADRCAFIGPDGRLDNPAALATSRRLQGKAGTGLDPCAVLQTEVFLGVAGESEVVSLLGDAAGNAEAQQLVAKYSDFDAGAALRATVERWDTFLGTVQVKTPDPALDLLINRWLPYQTLSCRLWARGGLYQAGGAFGFRDQLQDVMSLAMTRPDLARAHIIAAAGRQFPEGDVQHWWLAPSGHGVRTRIADSRLWLAYVTAHHVKTTGDRDLLDEVVPFIDGPQLKDHEHEVYFIPHLSDQTAPVYEHCARALDCSLATGEHGLALFAGGDWNDGMNRVGIEGRGESIWLSWFLIACLDAMRPHADARGDGQRSDRWRAASDALRKAVESDGWDGQWYRRGYFDDGTPLGSAQSEECQIDSVSQSWSILSRAGDPDRGRQAMASVSKMLIDRDSRLALLFTPPFDKADLDPGYIKAYPPGLRENGGQYTHAAAWCIMALAELGDGDAAGDLLSLINPIGLTSTREASRRYRLEPYVMAADVYSTGHNKGRGGWSWYTGTAGWTYRAALENVLGVRKEGGRLIISPCIPRTWDGFEVTYRHNGTVYQIQVVNPDGVNRGLASATLNGVPVPVADGNRAVIELIANASDQTVLVTLGTPETVN